MLANPFARALLCGEISEMATTFKRPTPVTVIAILHFIFGGMGLVGLLCAGLGIGFLAMMFSNLPPPKPGEPDPKQVFTIMDRSIIYYYIYAGVEGLIMSTIMVVAGFGLLKMRYWGRSLSLFYAIASILLTLAGTAYAIAVVDPAVAKWQEDLQKWEQDAQQKQRKANPNAPPPPAPAFGGMGSSNATTNMVSTAVGAVIALAYPIAVLIVMMLKSVRQAFAVANGDAPPPEEPPDDLDFDRPRRLRDDFDEPRGGDVR
jgi:hypothetical protein